MVPSSSVPDVPSILFAQRPMNCGLVAYRVAAMQKFPFRASTEGAMPDMTVNSVPDGEPSGLRRRARTLIGVSPELPWSHVTRKCDPFHAMPHVPMTGAWASSIGPADVGSPFEPSNCTMTRALLACSLT